MKSTHLFITGSPFCNCLARSGKDGYNMHITFFWKLISRLWRCPYENQRRTACLPGGDHRFPHRQQVKAAHHAEPAGAALAVQ